MLVEDINDVEGWPEEQPEISIEEVIKSVLTSESATLAWTKCRSRKDVETVNSYLSIKSN